MADLEDFLICPKDHNIPLVRDSFTRVESDGFDLITGHSMYEVGLYCSHCKKDYGSSQLIAPRNYSKHL